MASNLILGAILFFSSWAYTGLCQNENKYPSVLPCLERLYPCQSYIHLSTKPPPVCCEPLKDLLDDNPSCLCDIFYNPDVLRNFNITQEEALNLPKNCVGKPNISLCKKYIETLATSSPTALASSDDASQSSAGLGKSLMSTVVAALLINGLSSFILAF